MKKLLIIGASGSLGRGIISELKKDFEIIGTYATREFHIEGIETVSLDITDKNSFTKLAKNFDSVLLVAGAMPAMMKGYYPQKYIDVNITGTLNVLEFCRENEIPKLIYIMTFSDVAGSFYNGIPIQDNSKRTLNFKGDHAVYAISKVAASDLIEHYHQEYGIQTIIFRIPTVYCNDDNFTYYVDGELKTKAYIKMIQSIINKNKIEIWGNRNHAKDMPYIKDFSRLIGKAVSNEEAQGIYNAGTGNPVSLDQFVDCIINVFGKDKAIEKKYTPEKPSQPNFTFNMKKTMETFDYAPKYSVEEMMTDIKNSLGIDIFKL